MQKLNTTDEIAHVCAWCHCEIDKHQNRVRALSEYEHTELCNTVTVSHGACVECGARMKAEIAAERAARIAK